MRDSGQFSSDELRALTGKLLLKPDQVVDVPIGQRVDETYLLKRCASLRVIRPGDLTTMNMTQFRLTVTLNGTGRIVRATYT